MSTTTTIVDAPAVPKLLVTKRASIFWGSFIAGVVSNLLLIVTIFTLGVSTGVAGDLSFSWEQFGNTVTFLFGGIGSLVWLIGGVTILAATAWLVYWLANNNHPKWVVAMFAIGMFVGGFILWRLVDWSNFGFGFVPFLGLLAYTAFWAAVASFVIPALNLSRKRGTN
jgi:hypothetical protein